MLDLTFRCLDELRDYHRDLRAQGQSEVDLSASTAESSNTSRTTTADRAVAEADGQPAGRRTRIAQRPTRWPRRTAATPVPGRVAVTVVFEADLPLADMKARLVLNRLLEQGEDPLHRPARGAARRGGTAGRFTVILATDADTAELRSLADVEGVEDIRIEAVAKPTRAATLAGAIAGEPVAAEAAEPAPPEP